MYLDLVKELMKPWKLQSELRGVHALECCAAAAAQLQAAGEPWSPYGVNRAYAAVTGRNHETTWKNMRFALDNAGLPGPAETIRFLAGLADWIEGETIMFQWGRR
jgi:hypothetical protein